MAVMLTTEALRKLLAPAALAVTLGLLGYAAFQPHTPAASRDPHPRVAALDTTTSSPYWTLPPTANPPTGSTVPANPQVAMDTVQWAQVTYPGSCPASTGITVDQVSFAQPDPSDQLALALVQCGSGEEPAGLYAYEGAASVTNPTLLQALIPTSEDLFATDFSVQGSEITIQVMSGSPARTGACCNGLAYTLRWTWSKGEYRPAS